MRVLTRLASAILLAAPALPGATLSLAPGASANRSPATEGAQLSGIAWAGGDRYYAVDDGTGSLHPLDVAVAASSVSCSVGASVALEGARDPEGCAWDAAAGTVWVSMESTSAPLREYDPATGRQLRTAPVPPAMVAQRRPNCGLEALSISDDGLALWTCNEEALLCDGDTSSASAGTVVRLTRFTRPDARADWVADGQWAYETLPLENPDGYRSLQRSGVVGLCALPGGDLLVLEREFSGGSFRLAIFLVDFDGADDISALPALAGASFAKVGKKLLRMENTGFGNFEGICLGPRVAPGTAALVLVSDGGGNGFATRAVITYNLSGLDDARLR